MIIDIDLYIYTHIYKGYKGNRSTAAEISLLFLQEELKKQHIFAGERTEGLRTSVSFSCLSDDTVTEHESL